MGKIEDVIAQLKAGTLQAPHLAITLLRTQAEQIEKMQGAIVEAATQAEVARLTAENDLLRRQRNLLGERVAKLSIDVNNLKETVDWMMA